MLDRPPSRWNTADLDARGDGRLRHPDGLGRAPVGRLEADPGILKSDGAVKTVRHREMLEIRGGKITYSSITYDIKNFVAKTGGARES